MVRMEMSRIAEESKASQAQAASDTVVEPSSSLPSVSPYALACPVKAPPLSSYACNVHPQLRAQSKNRVEG